MEISPLEYAGRIAYSSKEVLRFTYDMSVKYKDAPGMYVECGVAAGAQIIAMAAGAPNKTIYAFDSFEGIPLPSNKDNQMPGIKFLSKEEQSKLPNPGEQVLESSGATCVPLEDFIDHLKNSGVYSDKIIPVRGWFEDTTAGIPKGHVMDPIQILRLDGDLYNSTYVCLQNLYPLLAKDGLVIIDDIQLPGCKAACDDYFMSIDFKPNYKYVDNIAYFIK
jgi:predicted O-methyltransferase YrrM